MLYHKPCKDELPQAKVKPFVQAQISPTNVFYQEERPELLLTGMAEDCRVNIRTKTASQLAWIREFQDRKKRPLRVLHIGNIANNAYNNARIQRKFGIEADVLCYDYYHIMACPEWEDASFDGAVDHANPDWWKTSLKGWRRPKWFVQGPIQACITYLSARHARAKIKSAVAWFCLETNVHSIADPQNSWLQFLCGFFGVRRTGIIRRWRKLSAIALIQVGRRKVSGWTRSAYRGAALSHSVHRIVYSQAAQLRRVSFSTIIPILLLPVNLALSAFLCASPVKTGLAAKSLQRKDACRQLVELQEAILTDAGRLGVLPRDRVREHISTHAQSFLPILSYYDVIQGYSIDGIIPLMNGIQTFASYEHGTIRNIPFEASELGVVCKHAYQQSPAVFLTNSDVLPASARLGLIPEKVTCLPHAFDDQKLRAFQKIHYSKKMGSTKVGPALFFSPTRHHWKHGDTSWKKGNDIFLRAAAHLVGEGVSLKIQLVEWGEEVEESRALIDELELSSYVEWLPTMRKEELWHRYCQAHAVVDQFAIPALGGVGFETMAFGRRLITAIDAEQTKAFFGEAPPCLCAQTTDECASRLREVALDLGDVAGKGKAAQEWIESYHSAERIVGLQVEAYKRMLEPLLT